MPLKDYFKKRVFSGKQPFIRLQVFSVISAIIVVIMVSFLSSSGRRETMRLAMKQFNQHQLMIARLAATGIEQFMDNIDNNLFLLSNFPAVRNMEPGILKQMKIVYTRILPQTSTRRLDKNGILRFIYPDEGWRKELVGRDYSREAYFQKAKETGNIYFSGLTTNEEGNARMRAVKPIYTKDEKGAREFNGVVICSFNPKILSSLYITPIISGEIGYAWLLNEEGAFIAHYEEKFVGQDAFKVRKKTNSKLFYSEINSIQRRMIAGEEGVGRYFSGWHRRQAGKIKKLIAYTPVRVFDKIWSVAVCSPVAEAELITKKAHYKERYIYGGIIFILAAAIFSFFIVFYQWLRLKQEINKRKQAEKRVGCFNDILKAIGSVNQFSLKEKDREKMLQSVCDNLIKSREYSNVWIILMKKNGSFITFAWAGVETYFEAMADRLRSGEIMQCIQRAVKQSGVVVITKPDSECGGCFLSGTYAGNARMITRLEHKSYFYGFLSIVVSTEMALDKENIALFNEVAGDVSFALYGLDLEAERKQAEEALKKIQKYTRELIEAGIDALATISAEGEITDVNHAMELITGIPKKELIGMDFQSHFTDSNKARKGYQKVFRDGRVRDYFLEIKHFDGKITPVLCNASTYKDTEGRVAGVFVAVRDITDSKKTEKKLQEMYNKLKETQFQLIQSEKMEAIGRMASGVAHEVKNPLGIIMQGINYFEGEFPLTQKNNREIIQMMKESVNRADSIVRALLDFSRVAEIDMKPEDVNPILEDSLLLVEHRGKLKNVEIIKELGKDIPKVQVNRGKIEQVFVNLLLNAIHAMSNGGKLYIRSYFSRLNKIRPGIGRRKTDSFGLGKKGVIIEIKDTGSGISRENMDKVFDPFFTTKGRTEGTGLGLAVTKSIVEMHKGIVNVESECDKGTKVTIVLKLSGGG